MILRVQPPPSTPPVHISHHPHRLRRRRPICIFQRHLFLSMSLPSSPRSPARQVFCYRRLSIRSPSLAVAANARHSRSYPSSSARRAQLCASWAAAQDHALGDRSRYSLEVYFHPFRMFHCLFFALVLFALLQPFPSYLSSRTSNLIAVFSTSRSLSRSSTYTFAAFNLFTGTFAYDAARSVAGWTSTLQAFCSLFPPFFAHSRA